MFDKQEKKFYREVSECKNKLAEFFSSLDFSAKVLAYTCLSYAVYSLGKYNSKEKVLQCTSEIYDHYFSDKDDEDKNEYNDEKSTSETFEALSDIIKEAMEKIKKLQDSDKD